MCKPRKPHVHAALICEWARGATIEVKLGGNWQVARSPTWDESLEYRIKPEPTDLELYGVEVGDVWSTEGGYTQTVARVNVCGNKYQTVSGVTCGEHRLKTLIFRRGEVNKLWNGELDDSVRKALGL